MSAQPHTHDDVSTGGLLRVLSLQLAIGAGAGVALWLVGDEFWRAIQVTAPGSARHLAGGSAAVDSWTAMVIAYERWHLNPVPGLYEAFFSEGIKFQYPPSSLLLLDLLPASFTVSIPDGAPGMLDRQAPGPLRAWAGLASQVATVGLILVSAALLNVACAGQTETGQRVGRWTVAVLVGASFYPVTQGHALGQVQVFLNLLAAVALLAVLRQRPGWAGALIGLCTWFKPQFAIVLIWALLRGHSRFAVATAAVAGAGVVLGVARYGMDAYIDYLGVLRFMSAHGEVFWANQSVNGLLHRLFENGDPTRFDPTAFAPADPVVSAATLVSSMVLLGAALWPASASRRPEWVAFDLATVLVAATIASPIAWEHHYGVALPAMAVSAPVILRHSPAGRATAPLLLAAFVAMASVVQRPDLWFSHPALGVLASHTLFGGLLLLALSTMTRMRAGVPA